MRRTAALAMAAVMTGGAAIVFLREDRRAPDGDAAFGPALLDGALQQALAADHLHGGQETAIGQLRQVFISAADADERFDLIIVRSQLFITDRPVIAVTVMARRLEIIIRQSITLAAPHNRAPADLATAYPIEGLVGGRRVRVVYVINEELIAVLVTGITFGLHRLALAVKLCAWDDAAVRDFV